MCLLQIEWSAFLCLAAPCQPNVLEEVLEATFTKALSGLMSKNNMKAQMHLLQAYVLQSSSALSFMMPSLDLSCWAVRQKCWKIRAHSFHQIACTGLWCARSGRMDTHLEREERGRIWANVVQPSD